MPSNFNSREIGSASWLSDGNQECRTDGRSVLFELIATLRFRLSETGLAGLTGPARGLSGTTISASDVPDVSLGWSTGVLQALYAVSHAIGTSKIPADYIGAIVGDISAVSRRSALSEKTMKVAIWLAYKSLGRLRGTETAVYNYGSPSEISFSPGTIFPIGGSVPPVATNGFEPNTWTCAAPGTLPPLPPATIQGTVAWSVPLLMALMVAGAIGIAIATKDAPKMADIRNRSKRKNPRRKRR